MAGAQPIVDAMLLPTAFDRAEQEHEFDRRCSEGRRDGYPLPTRSPVAVAGDQSTAHGRRSLRL
jgi:hypothetical protein